MAFTSTYIETIEDVIQGDIDKIQYRISDVWNDCDILGMTSVEDFRVITYRIPSTASGVVTGLRSVTDEGEVVEYTTQNINVNGTAAITSRFRFKMVEGVVT